MRLYTKKKGDWAGTQADAKKLGAFVETDVPTVKASLLNFLNLYKVNDSAYEPIETPSAPTRQPTAPKVSDDDYNSVRTHRESAWHNINRVAEDAPISELSTAMNIILLRIQEHLED